jgi:hypothetical protein
MSCLSLHLYRLNDTNDHIYVLRWVRSLSSRPRIPHHASCNSDNHPRSDVQDWAVFFVCVVKGPAADATDAPQP